MLGYKHTKQAIEKMKLRFANKSNLPMFGKKTQWICFKFNK